ncbi:MAG: hypothetical protein FOGNACKC_05298 [Anaerolineae bacterium]|nr:hypothetical protein [Anaerolineae bacterium]
MKNLGFILVSAVTVPILLLVGVYLLWPQRAQPQPPLVISIDSDLAPIETHLAEHEAEVQGQLDDIQAKIQQEQDALEIQTDIWLKKMADSQHQLEKLQAQAQELNLQIGRLEITRTTRLAAQQTELNDAQRRTQARLAEMEQELAETRSKLEQVKTELGN